MRIVVVEDELKTLNSMIQMIPQIYNGCKIVGHARNGMQGIDIILAQQPDLVIADIAMPQMNGLVMMQKVRDLGITCEFVILSGYSDFEYAQSVIRLGGCDYLLKPCSVERLKATLSKAEERMQQKHKLFPLDQLLKIVAIEQKQLDDEQQKHFAAYLATFSAPCYLVLLKSESAIPEATVRLIQQQLTQHFTQDTVRIEGVVETRKKDYAMLLSCPCEELKPVLEEILLPKDAPVPANIACAFEKVNVECADTVAITALRDCFDWNITFAKPRILCQADINNLKVEPLIYPKSKEISVLRALHIDVFDGVDSLVKEFFSALYSHQHHYAQVRETMMMFSGNVISLLYNKQYDLYGALNYSRMMEWIQKSLFYPSVIQILLNLIQMYKEYCARLSNCKNILVRRGILLIQGNYGKSDFSLDSASTQLKVSSEYLGSLFSKELGIKFTSYLTQWRVNEAKKMLSVGKYKVYEIASAVGYSDVGYFCKVFKKHTGYSTNEYSKHQMEIEKSIIDSDGKALL